MSFQGTGGLESVLSFQLKVDLATAGGAEGAEATRAGLLSLNPQGLPVQVQILI